MQKNVFEEFVKTNRDKINRISEAITIKNNKGVAVLAKDDPWMTESEWDEFYKDCQNKKRS